jgi:hypothetical protein
MRAIDETDFAERQACKSLLEQVERARARSSRHQCSDGKRFCVVDFSSRCEGSSTIS